VIDKYPDKSLHKNPDLLPEHGTLNNFAPISRRILFYAVRSPSS
jgi:hypothetical protein